MRRAKALVSFCGIILGLLLAGCAVNPVTGKSELAFYQISETEEVKLGQKSIVNAVQQMNGEYKDEVLDNYINSVGLRLSRVSHRPHLPYQFVVVNDSSPNAFALPGGPIAITRGLLVDLENEAQLAAVLGHEIGHVTARHAVQGLQRGMLWNLGAAILFSATDEVPFGSVAREVGQLSAVLVESSYSRDQERESDQLGIDYMVKARYNPYGAVQLQEYFLRKSEGEGDPSWVAGMFRTHPFSRDRLTANQSYIQSRYPHTANNPDYVLGRENFIKAIGGLRASRKGYEIYDKAQQQESQNNLDYAIDLYRQALTAAPGQALIYTGLGIALLKKEDVKESRNYLARAVQLDPNYYASRFGLGYVFVRQGNYAAAIRELQQSLKLLPTLNSAFFLAESYEKNGQQQKAIELYRAVASVDPNGKFGQAAAVRVRALGGQ